MNLKKERNLKILLSIHSCILFMVLYILKSHSDNLFHFIPEWIIVENKIEIPDFINSIFVYILILLFILFIFWFSTHLFLRKMKSLFEQEELRLVFESTEIDTQLSSINSANESFIITYLGLLFVSLSIPDNNPILAIGIFTLLVFIFNKTQSFFYNPIFLLLGFKFYFVSNSSGTKLLLITRSKTVTEKKEVLLTNLRRITDFTFIDLEKY